MSVGRPAGSAFSADSGRGCLFVNSAAEFPQFSHPVHLAVSKHKQGIRDNLTALAVSAGISDPDVVAEGLFILLEGSFVSGAMGQNVRVHAISIGSHQPKSDGGCRQNRENATRNSS